MRAMVHDAVIMCHFLLLRLEISDRRECLERRLFIPYPFTVFCGGLIWHHMDDANKQFERGSLDK